MNNYRELLLGCGHSREKRIVPQIYDPGVSVRKDWQGLVTLDSDPATGCDIVHDLRYTAIPLKGADVPNSSYSVSSWPTPDAYYDEIHAYEVLEHIGAQGDFLTLFCQFHEYWRILKPGGYFCATVPHWQSIWAWGDPGHTRIINAATLIFLDPLEYARQIGKTAMSDYRSLLGSTNFQTIYQVQCVGEQFEFVLKARK